MREWLGRCCCMRLRGSGGSHRKSNSKSEIQGSFAPLRMTAWNRQQQMTAQNARWQGWQQRRNGWRDESVRYFSDEGGGGGTCAACSVGGEDAAADARGVCGPGAFAGAGQAAAAGDRQRRRYVDDLLGTAGNRKDYPGEDHCA